LGQAKVISESHNSESAGAEPLRFVTKFLLIGLALGSHLLGQSHALDLTTGYNYQNSDQGQGVRASLNGWLADLQFDLNQHIAITGEIDSYYGRSQGDRLRQHNFVVGPQVIFRNDDALLRPFLYVQGGDQRTSSTGSTTHAFNLQVGGGFEIKLQERVHAQITPAEYNFALVSGTPTHSWGIKTAFVWRLWKQR
jgi:hypothetical protein